MEVILTQEVARLGTVGQRVQVKGGYARNYLIPRGLAVPADRRTEAQLQALEIAKARAASSARAAAQALAGQIQQRSWVIPVSVGEQGKLHGAVTAGDLADLLRGEGVSVEKQQIELERPLTQLGEFQVPVRLHAEVRAALKVQLIRR